MTKDARFLCNDCKRIINEKICYCGVCYTDRIFQLEKLEKIKKMIDEIIKLNKLDESNPYSQSDYTQYL